jgi:hypothetical protein
MALGLLALVATVPARAAPAELSGEVFNLGGGATVAVDGTTVTITVHIDLCCFDEVGTTLVAHIMNEVKAAQDMWNKALAKLPAHGCFDLKVVFDARLLDLKDPWDPGYNPITMYFDQPGDSFVYAPASAQNADFASGYKQTLGAQFFANDMTTGTWAHEIGHMMGLGDDYYYKGDPNHKYGDCLDGRGGTLMCNDLTGKIDQALADRLADIVNKLGLLPQCWKGTLKIASNFMLNKAERAWSDTWKADFKVLVDAKGKASGSGVNRRASTVKGHPYGGTPVQEIAIAVSGDADHIRLRLQFLGRPCVAGPAVGAAGGAARGVTGACGYSPAGSADFSRVQMLLRGAEKFTDPPRTYVFPVTAPGVAKGQFDIIIHGATGSDNTGSIEGQLECTTCAAFGSK